MGAREQYHTVMRLTTLWRYSTDSAIVLLVLLLVFSAGCAMLPVHETGGSWEPAPVQSVLRYVVQVGLYETQEEAVKASSDVKKISDLPVKIVYQSPFYRMTTGSFTNTGEAEKMVELFRNHGFPDARWVYNKD